MKTGKVRIQVLKVYDVLVDVPDDAGRGEAVCAAYDMQSTEIQESGDLQSVETDNAEFQEWVE